MEKVHHHNQYGESFWQSFWQLALNAARCSRREGNHMRCPKHPQYLGIFTPRVSCEDCWALFRLRHRA